MADCDEPAESSVAVVIPVYNEGEAGAEGAREVLGALAELPGRTALLMVDDGSTDDTLAALHSVGEPASTTLEVLEHSRNRGYGAALHTGAVRAAELGFDWVLFMDSDLTNPPEHIVRFVEAMNEDLDYLKATRYGPGSSVEGVHATRRVLSRAGNLFARCLSASPHRDPTNGFRAIRTGAFLAMPLDERGFPIIMQEWYWAQRHHLRGADVPTTLRTRGPEQRTSAFGYSLPTLLRYARYPVYAVLARFRRRPGTDHSRRKAT